MKKYFLKTFGCQMNYSDSEKLESILSSISLKSVDYLDDSDLVIYNTCSIKQHAEDRVFGYIHNAKKKGKVVGLTGCMVKNTSTQLDEKENKDILLKKFEKIDFVFRIEDMKNIPELLYKFDSSIKRINHDFNELDYLNIKPKLKESFRAYVPIMTGCDKFCTYCIVPFTRGKERSRKFSDIIDECNNHIKNGVKEIILVGQNVNAYFLDDKKRKTLQRKTDFAFLLESVANLDGLKRLNFTSPHPRHMEDDLIEVIKNNENILRNIHIPIQSGSTQILQKMGREHNINRFKDFTKKLRNEIPDITITTDIIVGFCNETIDDFNKTIELFDSEQFLMAYISKYSPRKGTVAGDSMEDNISLEEKKRRFNVLTEKLKESASNENKKALNTSQTLLIDEINDKFFTGKTHNGRTLRFLIDKKNNLSLGDIVNVKVTSADTWSLEGVLI
jgi:tRNA-2-methylthio-N6-dimethylallyladenosine synthase